MIGAFTLVALVLGVCGMLAIASRRFRTDEDPLIAAIDAQLPQTQCAQCGYPGCRPYAEALAAGAAIDLCPPGGEPTVTRLAELLPDNPRSGEVLEQPEASVAFIDEERCIGCYLCIDACPVDAIVGAPKYMHTVVANDCTGCELCVPPCPMDCIDMHTP